MRGCSSAGAREGGQPHHAGGFGPQARDVRLRGGDPVEDVRRVARERDARGREPDASADALEELSLRLGLQRRELLGDARRAHPGRLGDGTHRAEQVQLVQEAQSPGVEHPPILVHNCRTIYSGTWPGPAHGIVITVTL
jgi:hypothetical protein